MAKEEKAAEGAQADAAPKKSKKLLIIIVAAVLVVVLAGGGAAFFLLKKSDEPHDDEEVAAADRDAKGKKKGEKEVPPVFVPLEPFTSNLVQETGDQYLAVTLQVRVEDPATAEKLKQYMPVVRHEVLLLISTKRPSELNTTEGRQLFFDEVRDKLNSILEPSPPARGKKQAVPDGPIKAVLATQFIVQ